MRRGLRVAAHRLRSLFQRPRREEELAREIEIHIEQLTRELVAEGMTEQDARAEALRLFGAVDVLKEECRDMRRVRFVEDVVRDGVFAVRLARKSPGFTLTAVLSLALGIGANTAIFQLFDAVRLRMLPVERPEELVTLRIQGQGRSGNFRGRNSEITYAIWEQIQQRQTSAFAGMLAYGDTPLNLAPSGELRNVEGLWVSGSFFQVLGVRPQLGRLLTPEDDRKGCGGPGVVISHAFWQREFGGDPNVLSRTLPIDGRAVPVLGVTPPAFFGVEVGRRFDVAMPICSAPATQLNNRMFWFLTMMGRLKAGVPEGTARAELLAMSAAVFEATVPPYQPHQQAQYAQLQLDLAPGAAGRSPFRETFLRPLVVLVCMVVLVLLLACANLANMMLARATAREHEFAMRASLGASRWRLVRQVLMESLVLAFTGAAAGALAAPLISRTLVAMLSTARDPLYLTLESNFRVLAFTMCAGVLATILFGLAPALRAGRTDARGASASREKLSFRRALLVVQVSLCMVLLTAALLFSQSFRNLLTAETGFEPRGVLVASTFFNANQYPVERRQPAIEELHERLRAIPGVAGIARSYVIPISGSGWDRGARVNPTDQPRDVNITSVSEGYFRVMQTPMLAGRDFGPRDKIGSPPVAIVNETFAKVFFGGENPVGKIFRLDQLDVPEPPYEIVGLVGNTKYSVLHEEFTPIVYLSASQETAPRLTVRYVMRAAGGSAESLINPVKQVLAGMDPTLSVRFAVLESQMRESVLPQRMMAALTGAFGVLGAMLALTGVFGVTAYVVARRYREFGVRMALGATGSGIVRMVLGEAVRVVGVGVVVGAMGVAAAGRIVAGMVYGVRVDLAMVSAVAVAIGLGAVLAAWAPAVRASRVAPVEALRVE